MKVIGITGGVGAGKSAVIDILEEITKCILVKADDLAKSLEMPGKACYEPLLKLLGNDILDDGIINPKKMSAVIFGDGSKDILKKVNAIVHPAVKSEILNMIDDAKCEGIVDYFFIEAALLIEDGYEKICDELWYIYADEEVRRKRLKETRNYSDEKIDSIFASQMSEETFRSHCKVVIDNSTSLDDTKMQILKVVK